MKKLIIITLCSLTLALTGCGTSKTAEKALDEGKIAFASKEYEKAEGIFKLAVSEKGGKEAEALYAQVSAYRTISEAISSTEFEQAWGIISNGEVIARFFKVLDNLKIIEENKSESTIVTDSLEKIHTDVRISVSELTGTYEDYIKDLDIEGAEEYLQYIKAIEKYDFAFMKDYEIDIKYYEGLLEEAKKTLEQVNNNTEGYSKEAINKVLEERFGGSESSGASIDDTTMTIDGELCYQGQAFWNNGNRLRNFYVGTVTGNIYNGLEEKVGILETFNFGDIE